MLIAPQAATPAPPAAPTASPDDDRRFFEELREREFARLDRVGVAYLDYTGSALHPQRLVVEHAAELRDAVLGNPHSEHAPSRASTAGVEAARQAILDLLDADASEYAVCFTANATGALKLVGESYPFARGGVFVLAADDHNSVNGIRRFARRRGASVCHVPLDDQLRLAEPEMHLRRAAAEAPRAPRLFAFPAQSNFSGVRHPLALVRAARRLGYHVLLDAASYVASHPLSLRECPADFVVLSLYKIIGYPSGVGALVARREALARLRRPWFAGGTVDFVSVQSALHQLRAAPDAFEDGTPAFLALSAVPAALGFVQAIGMRRIEHRVGALGRAVAARLAALTHPDGAPLVRLYGPEATAPDRGACVAFNVLRRDGSVVPYELIEELARDRGVAIRGGCFCNPGAAEAAFGLPKERSASCLRELGGRFTVAEYRRCLADRLAVGALRASPGLATVDRDVDALEDLLMDWAHSPVSRATAKA